MLDVVSVASRQLLVVEPLGACEQLLLPLQEAGWALRRGTLQSLQGSSGDVVLIHLHEQPLAPLLAQLRSMEASWVAVLDSQILERGEIAELIGEWFFAALALPTAPENLMETLSQAQANARLRSLQGERQARQFLGNGAQARTLRKQLEQLSEVPRPLLISGERGSGKTLLARLVHERSSRAGHALQRLDCAGQAEALFDRPGHAGALAVAATGTLLLEGLATLSAPIQQHLLQHLHTHPGLHLISISRGELEEAVRQGRFREDLYRMLADVRLQTPRLREQRSDMLLLAEHFAKLHGAVIGRRHRHFSEEAVDAMVEHAWPGNVRELCNRVVRALVLAQGRQILARDLGLEAGRGQGAAVTTLQDYILRAERQALNDALARHANNMSQAARTLGISRPTFYRLLHKHRLR